MPEGGLTAEELAALEDERKAAADASVKAVAAAEQGVVDELLAQLQQNSSSSSSTPGVLGAVTKNTPLGPVKVAALSLAQLQKSGKAAEISAGSESGGVLGSPLVDFSSRPVQELPLRSARVCWGK